MLAIDTQFIVSQCGRDFANVNNVNNQAIEYIQVSCSTR